ncbi:hypothetical protein PGT21_021459 [Puccinia graminis f. sp. tritici]|uniref:Uncharacterized protein n=1 Tax=Puccinia graminis f. sp. tritici TaxID=56615 RepID=A0A5B0QBG3_PUCGR|nr:hypothetical protein PGT21_021459 [Puccinia graminis f. sp. tritici]
MRAIPNRTNLRSATEPSRQRLRESESEYRAWNGPAELPELVKKMGAIANQTDRGSPPHQRSGRPETK